MCLLCPSPEAPRGSTRKPAHALRALIILTAPVRAPQGSHSRTLCQPCDTMWLREDWKKISTWRGRVSKSIPRAAIKKQPNTWCCGRFVYRLCLLWILFNFVLQVCVQVKSSFKAGGDLLFYCCVLKPPFFSTLGYSLKGKGFGRNYWQSPVMPLRPRSVPWNKVLLSHYSSPHSTPAQHKISSTLHLH